MEKKYVQKISLLNKISKIKENKGKPEFIK